MLSNMVWSGHRHGLMVGLDDLTGLSNPDDPVILISSLEIMGTHGAAQHWLGKSENHDQGQHSL